VEDNDIVRWSVALQAFNQHGEVDVCGGLVGLADPVETTAYNGVLLVQEPNIIT